MSLRSNLSEDNTRRRQTAGGALMGVIMLVTPQLGPLISETLPHWGLIPSQMTEASEDIGGALKGVVIVLNCNPDPPSGPRW